MRMTLTIDDELLARASQLTGETRPSVLLRAGLAALVRVESAHRLAALGASDDCASAGSRRSDGEA